MLGSLAKIRISCMALQADGEQMRSANDLYLQNITPETVFTIEADSWLKNNKHMLSSMLS